MRSRPHSDVFASKQSGFSLVELMIVTAIIGIVAIGMSDLFVEMSLLQSKVEQGAAFTEVRNEITRTIKSPQAWAATVASVGNVEMACLRTNTACVSLVGGVRQWSDFTLFRVPGSVVFDGQSATAGFNTRGVACNSFSIAVPDANCPLSYNLEWSAVCPVGEDACISPNIEVRVTAEYSVPAHIHRGFDPNKHSFLIAMGGAVRRNERVEIDYSIDESGSWPNPPGESGANGCVMNWLGRRFNRIVADPGGNVTLVAPRQFQLRAGTYSCRIKAPAYRAGSVRIRLIGVAGAAFTTVLSAPVVAGVSNLAEVAQLDTNFVLSDLTTFEVQQYCTQNAPGDLEFGRAPPNSTAAAEWANVRYATVSCDRVRCFGAGCTGD